MVKIVYQYNNIFPEILQTERQNILADELF